MTDFFDSIDVVSLTRNYTTLLHNMDCETNYKESIIYNFDGTVNVPFGRAADWYINNVPMFKI